MPAAARAPSEPQTTPALPGMVEHCRWLTRPGPSPRTSHGGVESDCGPAPTSTLPPRGGRAQSPRPLTCGVTRSYKDNLTPAEGQPGFSLCNVTLPGVMGLPSPGLASLGAAELPASTREGRGGYSQHQEQGVVGGLGEGGRLQDLDGQAWWTQNTGSRLGPRAGEGGPRAAGGCLRGSPAGAHVPSCEHDELENRTDTIL